MCYTSLLDNEGLNMRKIEKHRQCYSMQALMDLQGLANLLQSGQRHSILSLPVQEQNALTTQD